MTMFGPQVNLERNWNLTFALCDRPDFDGLQWGSEGTSLETLPQYDITFRELAFYVSSSGGKPVGDLGASYSTLAVEGELRGIPVTPVDILAPYYVTNYYKRVMPKLEQLLGIYTTKDETREGFELSGEPIKLEDWGTTVRMACKEVLKRYLFADLADIPVADRYFSASLVGDAVPKHSATFEVFLNTQLPEILRVTDQVAFIYPLAMFKQESILRDPGGDDQPTSNINYSEEDTKERVLVLNLERPIFAEPAELLRIEQVAQSCGFCFELRASKQYEDPNTPEQSLHGAAALGVFTRKNG